MTLLRFASSEAARFRTPGGGACSPFDRVREYLAGWQSSNDDPACVHDSLEDGQLPGTLDLRFRVDIPRDGDYQLVPAGFALGALGVVVSRGAFYGEAVASATVEVEARAPSCAGSWSMELAAARVTGPWSRAAPFSGWLHVGEIPIKSCRAGETLEVHVRLVGATNRGSVLVDWFGFSAASDEDLNAMFGLRPLGAEGPKGWRPESPEHRSRAAAPFPAALSLTRQDG